MRFGVMQGVLGETPPGVFKTAKDLGFDGVELDWRDPGEIGEEGAFAPGRRIEWRNAAREAGVEIPSIVAHFLNGGGLSSAGIGVQETARKAIRDGIEICRDLGARTLLVPFFGEAELTTPFRVDRLVDNLIQLAPVAEDAGVVLAIEHSLPAARAVEILESVGSPSVADYWDMGNAMCFAYDPVREVTTLGRRIAQVHAKEYEPGGGSNGRPRPGQYPGLNARPFGQGRVPVREIFAALEREGYDGYVVIETGVFGDRKESARAALDVLRQATAG